MDINITLNNEEVKEALVNYVKARRDIEVELESITVKQVVGGYQEPTRETYTAKLTVK